MVSKHPFVENALTTNEHRIFAILKGNPAMSATEIRTEICKRILYERNQSVLAKDLSELSKKEKYKRLREATEKGVSTPAFTTVQIWLEKLFEMGWVERREDKRVSKKSKLYYYLPTK